MTEATEKKAGLGCPPAGCADALAASVYSMLAAGSPALAYCVARGVPLAPYKIIVQGTFAQTSVVTVPEVGNVGKLVQDVIIERISCDVSDLNTPNGQLASQADYYYALQSNISATLHVSGAPRYDVVPNLTPIKEIVGPLSRPWILGYSQGLLMTFNADAAVPFVPLRVTFTFHGLTTFWRPAIKLDPSIAMAKLQSMGYDCGPYQPLYCTPCD